MTRRSINKARMRSLAASGGRHSCAGWIRSGGMVLLASALSCAAPTDTTVEVVSKSPGTLQRSGEAIVILSAMGNTSAQEDPHVAKCIRDELVKRVSPSPNIVDFGKFRDVMFPWFEYEHAPRSIGELNELLSNSLVRERMASLNLRYVINIVGGTKMGDEFPGFVCTAGPGAAGCLGVGWEGKDTRYNAVVWDIASGSESARLAARSSGTSVSVGLILPLVFVAYTESDACRALAADLAEMIQSTEVAGAAD